MTLNLYRNYTSNVHYTDDNLKIFVKQEEIAKQLNKSLRTVKTIMSLMQEKKMIVRNNGKRNGEWVIL